MNWFSLLNYNLNRVMEVDPAAKSKLEVFLLYPHINALIHYRIGHFFYTHKWYFVARLFGQMGRFWTNIEIHPGATIGKGLIIDHGTGCVIGETAVIGDDCLLYHGVTLGGNGKERAKRHPTLKNHVMVGCNASVLGNITIGNNVQIGANSVVVKDIGDDQVAYGMAASIKEVKKQEHEKCPIIENVNE
ncbi:serine O-acetyltransferase EpsC [Traorella massiliensis]|uniref:serine O-acetyltransferase EpsC n=1 Tax=Traorella massiliensis TaxID=1903263 RepID=UPI0008F912B2|nr:serine O-acetyltransferase EpsC [Traorella massiliensis]